MSDCHRRTTPRHRTSSFGACALDFIHRDLETLQGLMLAEKASEAIDVVDDIAGQRRSTWLKAWLAWPEHAESTSERKLDSERIQRQLAKSGRSSRGTLGSPGITLPR